MSVLLALLSCSAQEQALLRELALDQGVQPLDPVEQDPDLVALGEALFFDPILSGNRDQSCATCHHPSRATGDGRSLAVGTGAVEEEELRLPGPDHRFTSRNSPALWDLGQPEVEVMFWDSRLAWSGERALLYDLGQGASGVVRFTMPALLDSPLAGQAMLPVLDRGEMRGEPGEVGPSGEFNELALISDGDFEGVWGALMERLLLVEGYRELFSTAFPGQPLEELGFEHAALGLAAYMGSTFQATDTSFDAFIQGEDSLDDAMLRGGLLFYGDAGCAQCHSGPLFSDQALHNIAVRPMTRGPVDVETVDRGAAHRTHADLSYSYAFRTPLLRNVTLTGPWMHNGCYTSLEAVLWHKQQPVVSLWDYDAGQLDPEFRDQVHNSETVLAEVERYVGEEVPTHLDLGEDEIADLVAFLYALESPTAAALADGEGLPLAVPSGLSLVEP